MMPPDKEQRERLEALLKLACDFGDAPNYFVDGLDDSTPLWKLYLRNGIAFSVRVKVDVVGQPTSHYLFPEFEALPTRMEGQWEVVDLSNTTSLVSAWTEGLDPVGLD